MDDRTDEATARLNVMESMRSVLASGQQPDLAAILFENHPTPDEIENAQDTASLRVIKGRSGTVLNAFICLYSAGFRKSDDPDFGLLVDSFVNTLPELKATGTWPIVVTAMSQMALKRSRGDKVSPAVTKKEKLVEYFTWIIRGRMDEISPLRLPQSDGAAKSSAFRLSNFLPSLTLGCGLCAKCGTPDAKARCSGCHMVEAGKIAFGTYY